MVNLIVLFHMTVIQ